ncbi:hypothetical protein J8L98_23440 [Pseudoalteromonas sp. MMG013]|uniref:hypothetical protein n=1 Tax=Pseudoalteromonas sp. MMG013 TaxID=2822687 RepID=UPI001B370C34|nr:hypothetical protein [Pseudoalteromonas sp. MMG013]MBQ4864642.1 hypothetical protein [Pseudoalteromonas sp. MMG013]
MTAVFLIYGVSRKEPNIIHISVILLTLNILEYIIYGTQIIDWSNGSFESNVVRGVLLYGVQLIIALTSFGLFIFRVSISRAISDSKKIRPLEQDSFITWSFLYLCIIYILALVESLSYNLLNSTLFSFIYSNYEPLVYIGWSLISASLITTAICHEKDLKKQVSDT